MASLHIINSPIDQTKLQQLLAVVASDDGILLTQDACYSLKSQSITKQLSNNNCYVLEDDLNARNISQNELQSISYDQFVALTLKFKNSITW